MSEGAADVTVTLYYIPDRKESFILKLADISGGSLHIIGNIAFVRNVDSQLIYMTTENSDPDPVYGTRQLTISPIGFVIRQKDSDFHSGGYYLNYNVEVQIEYIGGGKKTIGTYTGGWDSLVSDEQMIDGVFAETLDLNKIRSLTFFDQTLILNADDAE